MKDCASFKTLKGLLIAYNTIFWFSGPGTLGVGIWFFLVVHDLEPVLDPGLLSLPCYFMIGAGIAIFFFGIIGCLAIFNEKRRLLALYFLCIFLVFAVELTSCIKSFITYDELEEVVHSNLGRLVSHGYIYDTESTVFVDRIQNEWSCCGVYNWTDWRQTRYNMNVRSLVSHGIQPYPASCCVNRTDHACNLTIDALSEPSIHEQGCLPVIVEHLQQTIKIAGWSSFGCSSLQFIGAILVCCLRKAISDLYS